MHQITERNMLLRERADLPTGLDVATSEFREGWNFIQAGGASGLEKKIRSAGWHFIRIGDGLLRSGVGDTAQHAIAGALKLAIRSFSEYFNAVQVGRIRLTTYPWFSIARVEFHPYRIQRTEVQYIPDDAMPLPVAGRKKRLQFNASWLAPGSGCTVPMLRELLIESRNPEARTQ